MKKEIVKALSGITLFFVFCGLITIFGDGLIDTGKAVAVEPEDMWSVHVSLIEGPISWTHIVESKWAAQSYVRSLEEDEIHGGHWTIYLNGKEYEEGRWYKYHTWSGERE